jgi:Ran GTPase-activating protein (RanGAP) involved in mRNA processing and transport
VVSVPIHCPAIHVAEPVPAPPIELSGVLAYLRHGSDVPATRRFRRGTAQHDGRLDFCKQGLGSEGLRTVLDARGLRHAWLGHLLLGTNGLGDEGATVLGEALGGGLDVQTLYLGCNRIGPDGARALARGLRGHATARALWLKRNPIGEEGLSAVLDVLPRTRLRTLDLTNCGLGDAGVARVVAALEQRNVHIEHLFIGGNGLEDAAPLARWLASPGCTLETLFVSASRLGDAGATAIFRALASNRRLMGLDLASNGIGGAGLVAARGLSLRWLNLGASPATLALGEQYNTIGDDAVPRLAALCQEPLRHLGLASTALTSRGAAQLLAAVAGVARPPALIFGPGIARRLRGLGKALCPERAAVPEDLRFIASVYR